MLRNTENVGARFAEEARRIHERGRRTPHSRDRVARRALAEDGIEVMALPDFLDDDRLQ